MADFKIAHERVKALEGGWSNNKADRGGKTKYGITEATLMRAFRRGIVKHTEIQNLTPEEASAIYRAFYWDIIRGDEIPDQDIANEMFECGVNCGPNTAIECLQGALRAVNQKTEIDGIIGEQTIAAIAPALVKWKAEIYSMMNFQQGCHYMKICQGDASQLAFLKGWLNNRVELKPKTK
jgi:lysozyme family protein